MTSKLVDRGNAISIGRETWKLQSSRGCPGEGEEFGSVLGRGVCVLNLRRFQNLDPFDGTSLTVLGDCFGLFQHSLYDS